MPIENTSPQLLKANLTFRYSLAVTLVAAMFFLTFVIITGQIASQKGDAYIINISGMQRMLSQRIALLSDSVTDEQNSADRAILLQDLKERVQRMKQNHGELTSGQLINGGRYVLSDDIKSIYFGESRLDALVTKYIEFAQSYIQQIENDELDSESARQNYLEIRNMAEHQLLPLLNEAVSIYQSDAENKIDLYQIVEIILLCVGLSVLLLEVIFIFRPMANMVYKYVDKLNSANAELLEFTYRISHDLRAPATSSKGLVEIAEKSLDDKNFDTTKTALGHIKKSMMKMEALVDDILNLTRMKANDVEYKDIDVEKMVTSIFDKLRAMPDKENVTLKKDIQINGSVSLPTFFLQQTLENLVSNAIKYSDPNEAEPYVNLSAEKAGNTYVFRVSDNGLGIDEEYRKHIFGMFKRFHPRVSFGSGLGLYLVKQNVTNMGGEIHYKPLLKGSEFIINIPVV